MVPVAAGRVPAVDAVVGAGEDGTGPGGVCGKGPDPRLEIQAGFAVGRFQVSPRSRLNQTDVPAVPT